MNGSVCRSSKRWICGSVRRKFSAILEIGGLAAKDQSPHTRSHERVDLTVAPTDLGIVSQGNPTSLANQSQPDVVRSGIGLEVIREGLDLEAGDSEQLREGLSEIPVGEEGGLRPPASRR